MDTPEELMARIERAFAGVTLEDGVGLHETLGLDDRLSPEQCAALREKDEKHDWRKIPLIDLYRYGSCLHYFDAKGMRFHLPRILLYDLGADAEEEERLFREGLVAHMDFPDVHFALTYQDDKRPDRFDDYFSALNAEQIQCVISYLELYRDNAEEIYAEIMAKSIMHEDVEAIEKALPVWRARLRAVSAMADKEQL